MEQNTFRLTVYAIIAAALLYIFFFHFGPLYIWKERPEQIVHKQLQIAETQLGQYSHQKGEFPKEFTIMADGYESQSRNVVFECNYEVFCCPKGEACSKAIEWDNNKERRYYSFKQQKPVEISARCRQEDIYICKVFLGKEPAQVKITGLSMSDKELDLTKKRTTTISYAVQNTGQKEMIAAQATAKLYKIKKLPYGQEPEKTPVREFMGEEFALGIGEKTEQQIEIAIEENGDYQIEFTVQEKTDDTDYETKTMELKATGLVEIGACIPGPMEKEYFSAKECRYYLPCEDCKSILECERKWREKFSLLQGFEFSLKKYDDIKGSIIIQVPGEHRRECTRNCYPEYKVLEELQKSRKPIDLVFVIDSSGSMSDDIDEVRSVIEKIQEQLGAECRIGEGQIGVTPEACLQMGLYVFEGSFKDCWENSGNPFFSKCLQEARTNKLFPEYDSYAYVLCYYAQANAMSKYQEYGCPNTTNPEHQAICQKILNKVGPASLTKNYYSMIPQGCRETVHFQNPRNSTPALNGLESDIGYIPITTDFQKINESLGRIIASQGTEAWSDALYFAMASPAMNWRPNSEKAIILITDTANNPRNISVNGLPYIVPEGAEKTLLEAAHLAQEKKIRIFSLEGRGCDKFHNSIQTELVNYFARFGLGQGAEDPGVCPETDLLAISHLTSATRCQYNTAGDLPQKILEIVKDEVQRASQDQGLKICKEDEKPEICEEYCALPWESKCQDCSCFHEFDTKIEDYRLLDISFIIDATGSMKEEIAAMKGKIGEIISVTQKECERIGVKNCLRTSTRYVFGREGTKNLPFSKDLEAVKNNIAGALAFGGGDVKDPWAGEALISLKELRTNKSEQWSPHSKKIMVIITDAQNNPDEIVFEDYRRVVTAKAHSGDIDRVITEVRDVAKRNGIKVLGLYSEDNPATSPRKQLEWLAGETGGKAVNYIKGQDFSGEIISMIVQEIKKESEKGWCTADQCKVCADRTEDIATVPFEWRYELNCEEDTENCMAVMTCSPAELSFEECAKKWAETAVDKSVPLVQDQQNKWLYAKGTRKKEGLAVQGEDWTECDLPKITESCGGLTVKKGEYRPVQIGPYVSPREQKCTGNEQCALADCSATACPQGLEAKGECSAEGKCECVCRTAETPETQSEIACAEKIAETGKCYCETGNEALEYAHRIKEGGTPVDLLIVLDATMSMQLETTALAEAFGELNEEMQTKCVLESGEACLAVGLLGIGGYPAGSSNFVKITGSGFPILEKGIGAIKISAELNDIQKMHSSLAGIGFKEEGHEDEPWADAIAYSLASTAQQAIGWRAGAKKTILLIAGEPNSASTTSLGEVKSKVVSNNAAVYAAVNVIGIGGRSPKEDAATIGAKTIKTYSVPVGTDYKKIKFDDSGRPFTDILKIFVKEIAEEQILGSGGRQYCGSSVCDACRAVAGQAE